MAGVQIVVREPVRKLRFASHTLRQAGLVPLDLESFFLVATLIEGERYVPAYVRSVLGPVRDRDGAYAVAFVDVEAGLEVSVSTAIGSNNMEGFGRTSSGVRSVCLATPRPLASPPGLREARGTTLDEVMRSILPTARRSDAELRAGRPRAST